MAQVFVTATKSISFPKFDWGITAGQKQALPEDAAAQKAILAHPFIKKVTSK